MYINRNNVSIVNNESFQWLGEIVQLDEDDLSETIFRNVEKKEKRSLANDEFDYDPELCTLGFMIEENEWSDFQMAVEMFGEYGDQGFKKIKLLKEIEFYSIKEKSHDEEEYLGKEFDKYEKQERDEQKTNNSIITSNSGCGDY